MKVFSNILFVKMWDRVKIEGVSRVRWVAHRMLLAVREAAYKNNVIVS